MGENQTQGHTPRARVGRPLLGSSPSHTPPKFPEKFLCKSADRRYIAIDFIFPKYRRSITVLKILVVLPVFLLLTACAGKDYTPAQLMGMFPKEILSLAYELAEDERNEAAIRTALALAGPEDKEFLQQVLLAFEMIRGEYDPEEDTTAERKDQPTENP